MLYEVITNVLLAASLLHGAYTLLIVITSYSIHYTKLYDSFGGSLAGLTATQLGTVAAREAVKRAGLDPEIIDEVIVGNILSAGLGQNVARQIAIHAGLPESVPAFAINKLCGSGLRAVSMAAQFIMLGDADVILAGGTESMSRNNFV